MLNAPNSEANRPANVIRAEEIKDRLIVNYVLCGPIVQVARYEGVDHVARRLEGARSGFRRTLGRSRLLRGLHLLVKRLTKPGV